MAQSTAFDVLGRGDNEDPACKTTEGVREGQSASLEGEAIWKAMVYKQEKLYYEKTGSIKIF
jgi:hypothetical protein